MFRLLLGFKDGAAEADFRRNFGYHRRKLDIQFFAVQCLVNSAYFRHTTSAWQVAWLLGASFIPAFIYLSISSASKQRWRTPIILGLKLCMIVYVGQVFKNDYYPVRKTHSWPGWSTSKTVTERPHQFQAALNCSVLILEVPVNVCTHQAFDNILF